MLNRSAVVGYLAGEEVLAVCRQVKSMVDSPTTSKQAEQLKLVYDYSKFHIGLYTGLIAGVAALLKYGGFDDPDDLRFLKAAVYLILIAGLAGGMVATGVLDTAGTRRFWRSPSGENDQTGNLLDRRPARWGFMSLRWWILVEHLAFWFGVFTGLAPFLRPR